MWKVGCVSVFLKSSGGGKSVRKENLLPLFSARPEEEDDMRCRSKRHCFGPSLFFALTVHETAPFFSKHVVSFKWELAPKTRQIQNQAFNLRALCILVLGLGFLQLSP
jgi:hypothetical protein